MSDPWRVEEDGELGVSSSLFDAGFQCAPRLCSAEENGLVAAV
jgi:hypothetical protein